MADVTNLDEAASENTGTEDNISTETTENTVTINDDEKMSPEESVASNDSGYPEQNGNLPTEAEAEAIVKKSNMPIEDQYPWMHTVHLQLRTARNTPQPNKIILGTMSKLIVDVKGVLGCVLKSVKVIRFSKFLARTLFLIQNLYQDFTDSREYLTKMSELLAFYTTMELKIASKCNSSKIEIAERLTFNYDLHLKNADQSYLLRIISQVSTFFNQSELLNKVYKKYMVRPKMRTTLPDTLYVWYILTLRKWKSLETDCIEKQEINQIASLYCPTDEFKNNPQYAPFFPPYNSINEATGIILHSQLLNSVKLLQTVISVTDKKFEQEEEFIDLCDAVPVQPIDVESPPCSFEVDDLLLPTEVKLEVQEIVATIDLTLEDRTNVYEMGWINIFVQKAKKAEIPRNMRNLRNKKNMIETISLIDDDEMEAEISGEIPLPKISLSAEKELETNEKTVPEEESTLIKSISKINLNTGLDNAAYYKNKYITPSIAPIDMEVQHVKSTNTSPILLTRNEQNENVPSETLADKDIEVINEMRSNNMQTEDSLSDSIHIDLFTDHDNLNGISDDFDNLENFTVRPLKTYLRKSNNKDLEDKQQIGMNIPEFPSNFPDENSSPSRCSSPIDEPETFNMCLSPPEECIQSLQKDYCDKITENVLFSGKIISLKEDGKAKVPSTADGAVVFSTGVRPKLNILPETMLEAPDPSQTSKNSRVSIDILDENATHSNELLAGSNSRGVRNRISEFSNSLAAQIEETSAPNRVVTVEDKKDQVIPPETPEDVNKSACDSGDRSSSKNDLVESIGQKCVSFGIDRVFKFSKNAPVTETSASINSSTNQPQIMPIAAAIQGCSSSSNISTDSIKLFGAVKSNTSNSDTGIKSNVFVKQIEDRLTMSGSSRVAIQIVDRFEYTRNQPVVNCDNEINKQPLKSSLTIKQKKKKQLKNNMTTADKFLKLKNDPKKSTLPLKQKKKHPKNRDDITTFDKFFKYKNDPKLRQNVIVQIEPISMPHYLEKPVINTRKRFAQRLVSMSDSPVSNKRQLKVAKPLEGRRVTRTEANRSTELKLPAVNKGSNKSVSNKKTFSKSKINKNEIDEPCYQKNDVPLSLRRNTKSAQKQSSSKQSLINTQNKINLARKRSLPNMENDATNDNLIRNTRSLNESIRKRRKTISARSYKETTASREILPRRVTSRRKTIAVQQLSSDSEMENLSEIIPLEVIRNAEKESSNTVYKAGDGLSNLVIAKSISLRGRNSITTLEELKVRSPESPTPCKTLRVRLKKHKLMNLEEDFNQIDKYFNNLDDIPVVNEPIQNDVDYDCPNAFQNTLEDLPVNNLDGDIEMSPVDEYVTPSIAVPAVDIDITDGHPSESISTCYNRIESGPSVEAPVCTDFNNLDPGEGTSTRYNRIGASDSRHIGNDSSTYVNRMIDNDQSIQVPMDEHLNNKDPGQGISTCCNRVENEPVIEDVNNRDPVEGISNIRNKMESEPSIKDFNNIDPGEGTSKCYSQVDNKSDEEDDNSSVESIFGSNSESTFSEHNVFSRRLHNINSTSNSSSQLHLNDLRIYPENDVSSSQGRSNRISNEVVIMHAQISDMSVQNAEIDTSRLPLGKPARIIRRRTFCYEFLPSPRSSKFADELYDAPNAPTTTTKTVDVLQQSLRRSKSCPTRSRRRRNPANSSVSRLPLLVPLTTTKSVSNIIGSKTGTEQKQIPQHVLGYQLPQNESQVDLVGNDPVAGPSDRNSMCSGLDSPSELSVLRTVSRTYSNNDTPVRVFVPPDVEQMIDEDDRKETLKAEQIFLPRNNRKKRRKKWLL